MAEIIIPYLGTIITTYLIYITFRDANRSISKWVEENELKVISKEYRIFRTGPYWLTANRPVFRIVILFPNGERKVCWIRCSSFIGFNTKKFEVRCEKIKAPIKRRVKRKAPPPNKK